MIIKFNEIKFENRLETRWDILLRVVGDLTIDVGTSRVLQEPNFPLVELAVALANWIAAVSDSGPEFSFVSMESVEGALVTFTLVAPGVWAIEHGVSEASSDVPRVTTNELRHSVILFFKELHARLLSMTDILLLIDDFSVRTHIKSLIDQTH